MEQNYSDNADLNSRIQSAVESIEHGKSLNGLVGMIKNAPTMILKASASHTEARFQPGNKLVTYNGIDSDGNPMQETYGGGVAEIQADSVILKNAEPIRYPKGHPLEGKGVRGTYSADGKFKVNQQNGDTVLFNEYVSDASFVKGAYGIDATESWKTGFKLMPSYILQISSDKGEVTITTKSGIEERLHGGDYVVIDTKKGKVTSVHGCEKSWLDKTYISLEEHLRSLKN